MGYRNRIGPPNCQHLDNWRRCKIHKPLPWWLAWLAGTKRPPCILDLWPAMEPQDDDLQCPDQLRWPRPAPPKSQRGTHP
jgi:hypothetical protein